ncbi:hypothetical protein BGX31_002559, partial [Mortierella sp. GBA43]
PQSNNLRRHQSPEDEDDEFRAEITARHSRQPSIAPSQKLPLQEQQQPRQLASPALTFVEKEKKLTRFSSRFSFLNRRRQPQDIPPSQQQQQQQHQQQQPHQQQHHRHDSMPAAATKGAWSPVPGIGHKRFPSLTIRWPTNHGNGEEGESRPRVETPTSKTKGNNRVKKIFKDVLSLASKKKGSQSPEPPFRDISLPSTYIRATPSPSPHNLYQPQTMDQLSPYSPNHYAVTLAQRKGLVTPVSRTDTALSNGQNDNNKGKNPRESLVDPIQPHLAFQKLGLDDEDDELANQSPFGQTSLTPPPASSVLRHSASSHHLFSNGPGDGEPTFISPAATAPGPTQALYSVAPQGPQKTRPSSQLMPIPKELVDSGCDSMGGHEHHATASNATTAFNPSHAQQNAIASLSYPDLPQKQELDEEEEEDQIQQQPQQQQPQQQQQQRSSGVHPYDQDRNRTSMSSPEHGPKVVSIAQVQKVDLEGLRQSHHHHSPSIHSHSLNMVTVESPFA